MWKTILKRDHRNNITAKSGLIWFRSFRGEDLNVIFYQNMLKSQMANNKNQLRFSMKFGSQMENHVNDYMSPKSG
jgi:hypothetical protein